MSQCDTSCSHVRADLLGFDWDHADRQCAAAVLAHLEVCAACRQAAMDYDELREAVRPAADEPMPRGGWQAFGQKFHFKSPRPHPLRWRTFVATAAVVLVALGLANLYLTLQRLPTGVSGMSGLPASSVGLSKADIDQDAQAFRQVSSVFDHRAGWILLSDQATDLGLTPMPADPASPLLLVHLQLWRDAARVSQATLAVIPGQAAQVTIPSTDGHQLAYTIQTSAAEPGALQVYLEIASPGNARAAVATLATQFRFEPGRMIKAGQLATSQGFYELKVGIYQEAATAARPSGGGSL